MFQFSRKIKQVSSPFLTSKRTYFSRENIPTIGLAIGTCALCFQTMVLYPWHQILSDQFDMMKRHVEQMELISKQLNTKMDELIQLENAIKKKNTIVLNSTDQILVKLDETEERIQNIKKIIS